MIELEWNVNRALLTTSLTGGTDDFMPAFEPAEKILNIHCDYQNIVNCNKLS